MALDPVNECTFWYTGEYYQQTSDHNWQTRIGTLQFPECIAIACPLQFQDVPVDNPFYTWIRCLACRSVLSGYSTPGDCPGGVPCFQPYTDINRGGVVKIVSNGAGYIDYIPPDQQTFTDVPPSNPFWLYIERAHLHGLISGYSDGTFRPYDLVTRGQLSKIVSVAKGYSDTPTRPDFVDVPSTDPFYLYIERVYLNHIVSGYSCDPNGQTPNPCLPIMETCPGMYFHPCSSSTRGQTAKIVGNAFFPNCEPVPSVNNGGAANTPGITPSAARPTGTPLGLPTPMPTEPRPLPSSIATAPRPLPSPIPTGSIR